MADQSKVEAYVNRYFDALEAMRFASIPWVKTCLEVWRKRTLAMADRIAAGLPDDFESGLGPIDVIQTVFTFLEGDYPKEKQVLEILRGWVESLFATPPVVT